MTRRLAITPGEPAGVGPELLIKAVQRGSPHQLIAYADPELLASRARQIGLPLTILSPDTATRPLNPGELCVKPMPLTAPSTAGRLDPANAEYVLRTLDQACSDCLSGEVGCLITGPVHKGVINDSGVNFSGHTEYLAEKCGGKPVVMMLANNAMKVALATTHLPLRNVPDAITAESLEQTLRILHSDLISKFGIQNPRILVCGLNPHAGEQGHLGSEEITTISPVVNALRGEGMLLEGPLPADTLFTEPLLKNANAVLAMYHDQGLPVLKYAGFGESVNVTLGLPIVRTSVDHGTALDLAGAGTASESSLLAAIAMAAEMTPIAATG